MALIVASLLTLAGVAVGVQEHTANFANEGDCSAVSFEDNPAGTCTAFYEADVVVNCGRMLTTTWTASPLLHAPCEDAIAPAQILAAGLFVAGAVAAGVARRGRAWKAAAWAPLAVSVVGLLWIVGVTQGSPGS
jgi:hypothetical protein